MKVCLLCYQSFNIWAIHLEQCKKKDSLIKQTFSFIHLQTSIICKKCWKMIDTHQLEYHRKNCKRLQKKSKTVTNIRSQLTTSLMDEQIAIKNALVVKEDARQSQIQFRNSKSQTMDSFLKISNQMFTIFLNQWMNDVFHISPTARLKIFTSQIHNTCHNLQINIPRLNIEKLHKQFNNKLADIIKKTNDIFDIQRVQRLVDKSTHLTDNQRSKVYKQLNLFLKLCKVDDRYRIVRPEISEERKILLYRELIIFVLELFHTKMQKKIHLGLDLLIIFHSGLRFPSSYQKTIQGVLQILKNKQIYTTIKKQSKTRSNALLFLNEKLKQLLIKFGWKKFLMEKWQIQHFTRYFNMTSISLRRGLYIEHANKSERKMNPMLITGHTNKKTADIYLYELILEEKKNFHRSLIIPINQEELDSIKSYNLINKVTPQILNNELFANDTPINDWPSFQPNIKIIQSILPFVPDQIDEQISTDNDNKMEEQNQKQQQNELIKDEIQNVEFIINGQSFLQKNGLFNLAINFQILKNRYFCRYCKQKYKEMPIFCNCHVLNTLERGISIRSSVPLHDLQLAMPESYFQNNNLFNQIRFFLHKRGHYVTNVAIAQNLVTVDDPEQAKEVKLTRFIDYVKGNYFPPLRIKRSGEKNVQGTGVGLFATEDIPSNVFIGEYGGDILTFKQTILMRRQDMTMLLSKQKKLQIGTIKYASYIQLLNTSKESNCRPLKCVVNGKIAIIIYSERPIQKNQQLLYDYEGDFPKKFQEPLISYINQNIESTIQKTKDMLNKFINEDIRSSDKIELEHQFFRQRPTEEKPIEQPIEEVKPSKEETIAMNIRQQPNYCYAFAIFTILRLLKKEISEVDLFTKVYIHKKSCQINSILAEFKPNQKNRQHDAIQFFQFLSNKLYRNSPFDTLILEQIYKCQSCFSSSKSYSSQHIIYLQKTQECSGLFQDSVEKFCSTCNKNTNFKVSKRIISIAKRLAFSYKRFDNNLKKLAFKVKLRNQIQIGSNLYVPEFILLHKGPGLQEGHYFLYHYPKKYVIDMKKLFRGTIKDEEIYAIFYKRNTQNYNENIISKNIKQNNNEFYYEIASIVKLIVVKVARQLAQKLNVSQQNVIDIPEVVLAGGTKLQLRRKERLRELYQYSLVVSCCLSSYSIANYFGGLTKLKDSKATNQKTFINAIREFLKTNNLTSTYISDCTGLEPSISTIDDLCKLCEIIRSDENIVGILKKPSILHENNIYQNSNRMAPKLIGKTGFTKNSRSNFVGFRKGGDTLIALDYQKQKMWRLISQSLRENQ